MSTYYHDIPFEEMINRFMNSAIGKRVIHHSDFQIITRDFLKLYKYKCLYKDPKEYEVDKIVGKQIITHLQKFFNDKQNKSKTMKVFRKNLKWSKRKNKTHKSI